MVVATVGGGGVLLAAAAWLIKSLVSNRLTQDTEKFKIQIKADADVQIERVKSSLIMAVNLHERQVETLMKLYSHFQEAQGYFQRITGGFRAAGEVSDEEYQRLCGVALASARDTLLERRLLLPSDLAQQCDQFFSALFEGQMDLGFARNPMVVDGLQRAEFWKKAAKTAYEKVPSILEQIEKAARKIIHCEE
jgi:hypothetical protein